MLSFGMEYERAFSIAFASARFAAGSGPPSRAATISARESFEKSWPRFLSAAPFLCLIELHLLCPDMSLLPDEVEEPLVHARVIGQLRMEGGDQHPALAQEHRVAVQLGQHLHLGAGCGHTRRADEYAAQRPVLAGELEIGLEARHLPSVAVPRHLEVKHAEVIAVEEDHPRARAEQRLRELPQRVLQPVQANEPHDRGRLAARDDEPVEAVELLGLAHLKDLRAQPPQ